MKKQRQVRRAHRVRTVIAQTSSRPRLSVFRSAKHISAQVIDDKARKTVASASDLKIERKGVKPMELAKLVGQELGKRAVAAGITEVVFDRGRYKYHGRVKALAEAAREQGLQF